MDASDEAKARAKALAKAGAGYYPHIEELGLRTQALRMRAFREDARKADPREIELDFEPPF